MWSWSVHVDVELALGDAFLAGDWTEAGLVERADRVIGGEERPRWLVPLVRRVLATYRERPADRRREFQSWLGLQLPVNRMPAPRIVHRVFAEPAMARTRWDVPSLRTASELATFLALHPGELDWFADTRGLERIAEAEQLRHYRYVQLRRPGRAPRLLECPKRHLKELQRWLLRTVLDQVPPHPAAHGFRRGHSVLTHARHHVSRRVVLAFDLEDFFASVTAGRVYGVLRAAGYPEQVAYKLTGLCTNTISRSVWQAVEAPEDRRLLYAHHRLGRRLAQPHLPQGAPTSPALANLAAYRLDVRLSALAAATGSTYSRYADDLAFSGETWLLEHQADFRALVEKIVRDESFRLNERKSRLTTKAGRQVVTGVVVNEHPNATRRDFDRLKAVLHDAARHGAVTANRRGVPAFREHLLGRITWIESLNPQRGRKLRRLFAEIDW